MNYFHENVTTLLTGDIVLALKLRLSKIYVISAKYLFVQLQKTVQFSHTKNKKGF